MAFHGLSKTKLAKERVRKNAYNQAKKSAKDTNKLRLIQVHESIKKGVANLIKMNK
jgi:hypothetical protein